MLHVLQEVDLSYQRQFFALLETNQLITLSVYFDFVFLHGRYLELSAIVHPPKIAFDPLALVLTPVPLKTAVYAEFNIIATGYHM